MRMVPVAELLGIRKGTRQGGRIDGSHHLFVLLALTFIHDACGAVHSMLLVMRNLFLG